MTINTSGYRQAASCNGVTTAFAFPYPFQLTSDLVVTLLNTTGGALAYGAYNVAAGATQTLTLSTDYTVTGTGGPTPDYTSGTVTTTAAPVTGFSIVITRAVPETQTTSWPNNVALDGPTLEAAFDKVTLQIQQVDGKLGRSPVLGIADTDGSGAYQANGNRLTNLGNAVNSQDAVTLTQLQTAQIGASNVPTPGNPADNNKVLLANGGTFAWSLPAPVTGAFSAFAPIASPTFTGTPSLPTGTTGTTQSAGDSSTKLATTAFVATRVVGVPTVVGADCANNAGTPNTKFDINCSYVVVSNPSTGDSTLRRFPGVITNDVTVAQAANGRDQAGAFSASTWVHFYYIWNGATLATLSSANAPSTGPTLPSGYTHWAYVGAVFFNGSSALVAVHIKGRTAYYDGQQAALAGGAATALTAVSCTSFVPPNAMEILLNVETFGVNSNASGQAQMTLWLSTNSGGPGLLYTYNLQGSGSSIHANTIGGFSATLANVSQQFFYNNVLSLGATPSVSVDVHGYTLPNGG